VSPAIFDLIGGDGEEGATLKQPKAAWGTKELGSVFQIRNKLPANVDGSTNSTNETTSISTNSLPHQTRYGDQQNTDGDIKESKSSTGAIAGGVIGGFVGLGLLLGLLVWWRKCQGAEQTAIPELGANEPPLRYHPSHSTPYMSPQELPAYEPPQEL